MDIPSVLEAPVAQGQPLAQLRVTLDGSSVLTTELRALEDNPEGSFWQRTWDGISLMFE